MDFPFKALIIVSVLLMASTVLGSPSGNLVTGMFGSDFTPGEQSFVDRKFREGGFSIMSSQGLEVERARGTSYVYPQGIDMKKFDKNIFSTSLQNSQGYRDRENFRLLVEESDTLNQLQARGLVSIDSRFKSSDFASVEITGDPVTVFQQLSESETREVDLNYRVKALNDEGDSTLGGPRIRSDLGVNGSNITIAVLDTGVNSSHPDLQGSIIDEKDFTGKGVSDQNGHGTHVAASALGDGSASSGTYAGTAPEASLMNVKVLEETGGGNFANIIDGMEYAADNNADILSMSLGGFAKDTPTSVINAVEYARNQGSVVVAAAGNDGEYNRTSVPAAVKEAIAVGATDNSKNVAFFTSGGPVPYDGRPKHDVGAPGVSITSAKYNTSQAYTDKSGTSMSTPLISGIVALGLQHNSGWDNEDVENALTASGSSNKIDDSQNVFQVGTGVVNASRALRPEISFSETSFSFLDAPAFVDNTQNVTVTNNAGEAVNYSLGSQIHRFEPANTVSEASNASISFDRNYIQLGPGESKELEFNFTITEEDSDPFGALIRLNEIDSEQSYAMIAGGYSGETGLKANFSLNASTIDVTDKVEADASDSEPSGLSYSWDMGDSTSLSGEVINYSYSDPGNYTVELVVEKDGASSSMQKGLEVDDLFPPSASFDTNVSTAEVGLEDVRFDASSSSDNYEIDRYEWDFGDNGVTDFTVTDPVLVKKFNDTGLKTIRLTVYDASGRSDSTTVDVDVQDTTGPDAVADSNTSDLVVGEDLELDGSLSSDNHEIKNYTWNNSMNGETVVASFSEPGTKSIGLEVFDRSGNSGEDSLVVEVSDESSPVAEINVSPRPGEAGVENVSFNGSKSFDNVGIVDYRWDIFQNGSTETGETVSRVFYSPGNYSVELEVEDSSGNTNSTVSDFELVDTTVPDLKVELDNDYPETEDAVRFNASNTTDNHEIKNFTWSMGDGTEYTGETVQHSYSSEGNFTATLEVYDQSLNKASKNIDVEVKDLNVSLVSPLLEVSEDQQWINASFTRPVTDVNFTLNSEDLNVSEENSTYFYTRESLPEGNNTLGVEASNNLNYSTGLTREIEGLYPPVIEFLDIEPRLGSEQINFTANITEDNFNETGLNLTLPNSTEKQIDLENTTEKTGETAWNVSYEPEQNGAYTAGLSVEDDLGLNTSSSKDFKVSKPVDFNNSFSSPVEWKLEDSYGKTRESGTDGFNLSIPADENWVLEINDSELKAKIKGTNVTEDINTSVEWNSQASNPDIDEVNELKTVALRPELNFSEASIKLNVSGADKLFRCDIFNFSTEECETEWNDVTDQALFSNGSVSFDTTGFSGFTAAEEQSSSDSDDSVDSGDDSGGSGGSTSSSSSSPGFGGYTQSPDVEVETTDDSVYIYNIFESDRLEIDTGLPIREIGFEPEKPDNETIRIEEVDLDTEASMQSVFEVNSSIESLNLEMMISEEWMDENRFSPDEISFYSRKDVWTDVMPEKQNLSVNATVENGTYGLGTEKACYSSENISAVMDSCSTYSNPCEVPDEAETVESCEVFEEKQELSQRVSDLRQEASEEQLERVQEVQNLVENGEFQRAREELSQIEIQREETGNRLEGLVVPLIVASGLILVVAVSSTVWIYRKRKNRRQLLEELEEMGNLLKDLDHKGRDIQRAEEKLLQAYKAAEEGDFSTATKLTEEVKELVR